MIRQRKSTIGKVEYEPDSARIVAGLVDVLTYQPRTDGDSEAAERQAAAPAADPDAGPPPAPHTERPPGCS